MRARSAPRAARMANSLASRGAHQQQIGNIGVAPGVNCAHRRRLSRATVQRQIDVVAAILRCRCHQLSVGLHHRQARLEYSGHQKVMVLVFADGRKLKRQPDVRPPGRKQKSFPDHTHNRAELVTLRERFSDCGCIAAESPLPQAVTQHHHFAAMAPIFMRRESTSPRHWGTEEAEKTLSYVNATDLLGPFAGAVEAGATSLNTLVCR